MQPSVRHVTNDAAATDRSIVAPTIAEYDARRCTAIKRVDIAPRVS